MEDNKVGKAISFLRKRAGYTQKDLAERIGVSDKAVSKWERGVGLPDVGYLRKLSILLDTDTDSLLAGDVVHHDGSWDAIIVLDENPYGIHADTVIYDKPLIAFLISYCLLVGIGDITVIGTEQDQTAIDRLFGSGKEYGIRLTTVIGKLKDALETREWDGNIMMLYGRCFLYGVDQTRFFQRAMMKRDRLTMLVLPKRITYPSPSVVFDHNKRVILFDSEEPLRTQYEFSPIPIIFFPAGLLQEMAAQPDVESYVRKYSIENDVYVHMLDRGFVEIEVEDRDSVQDASAFLKIVQKACGMNVYCIEEVAWRRGFISLDQLKRLGERMKNTQYGQYVLELYGRIREKT